MLNSALFILRIAWSVSSIVPIENLSILSAILCWIVLFCDEYVSLIMFIHSMYGCKFNSRDFSRFMSNVIPTDTSDILSSRWSAHVGFCSWGIVVWRTSLITGASFFKLNLKNGRIRSYASRSLTVSVIDLVTNLLVSLYNSSMNSCSR